VQEQNADSDFFRPLFDQRDSTGLEGVPPVGHSDDVFGRTTQEVSALNHYLNSIGANSDLSAYTNEMMEFAKGYDEGFNATRIEVALGFARSNLSLYYKQICPSCGLKGLKRTFTYSGMVKAGGVVMVGHFGVTYFFFINCNTVTCGFRTRRTRKAIG
jgi:hypothetical protein